MTTIDKTALNQSNRDLPLRWDLGTLIDKVSLLKPRCEFKTDDACVHIEYRYEDVIENGRTISKRSDVRTLQKVNVFEDGEALGYLFVQERYTRGSKEMVYGIGSFRIQKERGNPDATVSKNIKVVLRHAKKAFVGRENDELIKLIDEQVKQNVVHTTSMYQNAVRYNLDIQDEATRYAMQAYHARKRSEATVNLPSTPVSVKDIAKHDKQCEQYEHALSLFNAIAKFKGYGVSMYTNGSMAVLSFADMTVLKYQSFGDLPVDIQSKLAMFKVIGFKEPYAHLGCKFEGDMYYIVGDELALES